MKVLKKRLLDEICDRLQTEGYRKSRQTFRRGFEGGAWMFHVAFIPHPDDLDITADVAVRHDSVQERSRLYEHLTETEKKQTATLGVELGNLQGIGQHRWTVRTDSDVVPVVESILKMFHDVGVPFLERFTSMEETRRVFLHDEAFARLISPGREYREERASILRDLP